MSREALFIFNRHTSSNRDKTLTRIELMGKKLLEQIYTEPPSVLQIRRHFLDESNSIYLNGSWE